MLDETHWPATSALLDEACGVAGNALLVGEGPPDDTRVTFVGLYYRGQRRLDLEREYLERYHPINEAIPQQLHLPAGQLVPIPDLYTTEELKTSRTYNEALRRSQYQQGVNVLLAGPGGLRHDLVARGSGRRGGLGVVTDRDGPVAHAPCPSIHPCPAGAGPCPGGGHDRDGPARDPADRRPPPGPARADPGGQ